MKIKHQTVVSDLLFNFVRPLMHRSHWDLLLSGETVRGLLVDRILTAAPLEMLDGLDEHLDLPQGKQKYLLEVRQNKVFAIPRDFGASEEISHELLSILSLDRSKLLSLIASVNGFNPTVSTNLEKTITEIGHTSIAGKVIRLFIHSPSTQIQSLLNLEKMHPGELILICSPNHDCITSGRVVFIPLPNHEGGWIIDHTAYLRPEFGFRSIEVASLLWQRQKVDLLLDQYEGAVFIYGIDLQLKPDSKEFNFIIALSEQTSPIELTFFVSSVLRYKGATPDQVARDVQTKIRKAIESNILDEELQGKALAWFKTKNGKVFLLSAKKQHWPKGTS